MTYTMKAIKDLATLLFSFENLVLTVLDTISVYTTDNLLYKHFHANFYGWFCHASSLLLISFLASVVSVGISLEITNKHSNMKLQNRNLQCFESEIDAMF